MFIIGGFDGLGVTDKIIKLDLRNFESEVIEAKLKFKRENHTTQILNGDSIVVAGGWDGNKSMDKIEIFKYDKEKQTLKRDDDVNLTLEFVRNKPCSIAL